MNITLPALVRELGATPTELQLVLGGYALAYAMLLIPSGRWGDSRSRRRIFLVGLAMFVVASQVCALAPTGSVLVLGRVLQGAAAGMQAPQTIGLIQQLFTSSDRARAFGWLGVITSGSTAVGPTLAGLLLSLPVPESWRLVMWINVPLGVVTLVAAVVFLPRTQPDADRAPARFDVLGTLLLAAAMLLALAPLLITTGIDDDPRRWLLLGPAAGTLALFVAWEARLTRRRLSPLIDPALFRVRTFRRGSLMILVYYTAIPGIVMVTTQYLGDRYGLDALTVGLMLVPYALASVLGAAWGGRRLPRMGQGVVVRGVVIEFTCALAILLSIGTPVAAGDPWVVLVLFTAMGIGAGMVLTINQAISVSDVPVVDAGLAGSINQLCQRLGFAVGLTLATALYYTTLAGAGGVENAGDTSIDAAYRYGVLAAVVLFGGSLAIAAWPARRSHC